MYKNQFSLITTKNPRPVIINQKKKVGGLVKSEILEEGRKVWNWLPRLDKDESNMAPSGIQTFKPGTHYLVKIVKSHSVDFLKPLFVGV